ncbi:MAG TPA: (d)CMP kinase [Thermotogota bacterium]|nr:(d)CMP kinase [Thermotogota bacterium]HPJ88229.1 (d)CMP kinase [Thermotogota bacterium]
MSGSFSVAIDGPAGSGKSSISNAVCESFGFLHFDSGACYRAIAYYFLSRGINNIKEVESTDLPPLVKFKYSDGIVYINDRKLGEEIRTPEVSMFTSDISTLANVREFVTDSIRDMVDGKQVVMDGRDIGTVVLPDADLKIFLTATAEERACRRLKEWDGQGIEIEFEKVVEEIKRRDEQDTSRTLSPLKPATDSVIVDTTSLSFDEVVNKISELIRRRKG